MDTATRTSSSLNEKTTTYVSAQAVDQEQEATISGRTIFRNRATVALDLVITVLPLYFVIFAIIASCRDGTPAQDHENVTLMKLAKLGPTIFPYIFGFLAAKMIKAIATWRLEQGATVGLVEYLLGSRSLASAVLTPVKLGIVSWFVPALVILWALSPLGGQSSLRIITIEPKYNVTETSLPYLNLQRSPSVVVGGSSMASFQNSIAAAYTAALSSPGSSKNGTQDVYGNLQIPMLEALPSDLVADSDGWYDVDGAEELVYASMLGVPFANLPGSTNITFDFETSYFHLACNLTKERWRPVADPDAAWSTSPSTFVRGNMAIRDPMTHTVLSKTPRRIGFQSRGYSADQNNVITQAFCDLTTTYVQARASCLGSKRDCSVIAIRASEAPHPPAYLSALDGQTATPPEPLAASNFWASLFASLGTTHAGTPNSFEYYFVNPEFPYSSALHGLGFNVPPVGTIGEKLFAQRFAQLLNTFWMTCIAPFAMTGEFTPTPSGQAGNTYAVAFSTEGQSSEESLVLRCHYGWLAVLVVGSCLVFMAGVVTAYLDAHRRGPDLFDNFTSILSHNPFVHADLGPSMEDAGQKAKRLRKTVIRLGDVRPGEAVGLVAIATPSEDQPVEMLKPTRYYS